MTPPPSYSGMTPSSRLKTASYNAVSITWPRPAGSFRRRTQAMTIPKAVCRPARVSPILRLGLTGGPSGKPLTYRNPPKPSQTEAKPGRRETDDRKLAADYSRLGSVFLRRCRKSYRFAIESRRLHQSTAPTKADGSIAWCGARLTGRAPPCYICQAWGRVTERPSATYPNRRADLL